MKKVIGFLLCLFIIIVLLGGCSAESNVVETDIQEYDSLLLDANVLTDIAACCVYGDDIVENPQFDYVQFLVRCAVSVQKDFCYYNLFPLNSDYRYEMELDKCSRIIFEVFGEEKWDATGAFTRDPYVPYNEAENTVAVYADRGWGTRYYAGDYKVSQFNEDKYLVTTSFELFGPADTAEGPASRSMGMYTMTWHVTTGNGKVFLRFDSLKPQ